MAVRLPSADVPKTKTVLQEDNKDNKNNRTTTISLKQIRNRIAALKGEFEALRRCHRERDDENKTRPPSISFQVRSILTKWGIDGKNIPFNIQDILKDKIIPSDELRNALEHLLSEYRTVTEEVAIACLRTLAQLGLHNADVRESVLTQLGRRSLIFEEQDEVEWPLLCEQALKGLDDPILTIQETWRQVLWSLTDAPEPTERESPFCCVDESQWKGVVEFLLENTSPDVASLEICPITYIRTEANRNDMVSLFHALCVAIQQNGLNAKHEGWKHRVKLERKMPCSSHTCAKEKEAKEDAKDTKKETTTAKPKYAFVAAKESPLITDIKASLRLRPLPLDAFDRRVERLCYIARRLIDSNIVHIDAELGFRCTDILLPFVKRLHRKAFVHFQFPRKAIHNVHALLKAISSA